VQEQAVIDRIVDGKHAVLLVGEQEVERIVPVEMLPNGAREGTWLTVSFRDDQLVHAEIDVGRTEAVRERIADKLNRLRARGRREN